MARRKVETVETVVDGDGYFVLTGERLWKWRAREAELRAAQSELDATVRELQAFIDKVPELSTLFAKKTALAGALSVAKGELATVQTEIESVFGISLKECAFDDASGRLYHLVDGQRGEPIKRRKR